jgi:uncharacterized membrane protein YeiB
LALFGVLAANVVFEFRVSIFEQFLPPAQPASLADRALQQFLTAAVELKALARFSFLFGLGLPIQLDSLSGNPLLTLLIRWSLVLLVVDDFRVIFHAYGLGLFGRLSVIAGFTIGVAVYAVQVAVSALWLDRYRYGPVEWLWRSLMYGNWNSNARG